MWYPYLLGSVGTLWKRERIRLIVKLPGYELPRSFPTTSGYDWFTTSGQEEEKEFQALLYACNKPEAPESPIGSTCFTTRAGDSLYTKLFTVLPSTRALYQTYALNMADQPCDLKRIRSDGIDHVGGMEGDYIWFKDAQVVFNVGQNVPQDLYTTFIE